MSETQNLTRIIGDTHGNWQSYLNIIEGSSQSLHVGDFGLGPIWKRNPIENYDTEKHFFIRGNHDDLRTCQEQPNYIKDGTVKNIPGTSDSIMFVGGAWSIDWAYRTSGLTWWEDEELSYEELDRMISIYEVVRPKVMITHEAPEFLVHDFGVKIFDVPSRTRSAFEAMWKIHKPVLWICGHWHLEYDRVFEGTRFIVLDCDSWIDLDLNGDCRENIQTSFQEFESFPK